MTDRQNGVHDNPFVGMSTGWRTAIVGYFIVFHALPVAMSMALHSADGSFVLGRVALMLAADVAILVPFVLRRLAGLPTGWLHPMVFPTLLSMSISLVRSPDRLLYPLLVFSGPIHGGQVPLLLRSWPPEALAAAQLKNDFLILLAAVSMYAGFMLLRMPNLAVRWHPPRTVRLKMMFVLAVLVGISGALVWSSGGVASHIASFSMGRFRALGEQRYLTGLVRFAPYALTLWYCLDQRLVRRVWFPIVLLAVCGMQFVTVGSRSATVLPLVILLGVWIYHHRTVPTVRVAMAGVAGLVAVGVLGQIRQTGDWRTGEIDVSSIVDFNFTETLDYAAQDIENRNRSGVALPTVAFVPDRVPYLWGRSYVAAVTFFVPRALWPNKPRGVGAYARAIVMGGSVDLDRLPEGGSTPPGAVAEAYWSFDMPGVVVVFLLFGGFLRWVAGMFVRYRHEPAAFALYLTSIEMVTQPTSPQLNPYLRTMTLLVLLLFFLGILRLRVRAPSASHVPTPQGLPPPMWGSRGA